MPRVTVRRTALGAAVVAGAVTAILVTGRLGSPTMPAALDAPHFVEEALAAGIEHRYDGEFTFFVGGGVAAFDCDDDARPDLYFAGAPSRQRSTTTTARSAERCGSPQWPTRSRT